MTEKQLFNKYNIPLDIQRTIQVCNSEKDKFNKVLNELLLQYNYGLWWLYWTPKETLDNHGNIIDTSNNVSFNSYNDDDYICEQAIIREELLNELIYVKDYFPSTFESISIPSANDQELDNVANSDEGVSGQIS